MQNKLCRLFISLYALLNFYSTANVHPQESGRKESVRSFKFSGWFTAIV